jgi:hypothetical protein
MPLLKFCGPFSRFTAQRKTREEKFGVWQDGYREQSLGSA